VSGVYGSIRSVLSLTSGSVEVPGRRFASSSRQKAAISQLSLKSRYVIRLKRRTFRVGSDIAEVVVTTDRQSFLFSWESCRRNRLGDSWDYLQ